MDGDSCKDPTQAKQEGAWKGSFALLFIVPARRAVWKAEWGSRETANRRITFQNVEVTVQGKDEEDQMKAEAVWAEVSTGEGAPTRDTELRAVLLNQELAPSQVLEFSTSFLLPASWAAVAPR